jgi:CubicO group peptidase (beta-lactamase class C family)
MSAVFPCKLNLMETIPVPIPDEAVTRTDRPRWLRARRIGVLALAVVWVAWLAADRAPAQEPPAVRQRIMAVENGLVPAKGGPGRVRILDRMRQLNVPGASVAVIRDFKVEWAKGYGVADRQTGAPVTPETLFQAASMSKPVAALGALKLVERGQLDLDRDVNTYLKSWKVPQNQFTRQHAVDLRSLLSHTAGTTVHGFGGYPAGARLPTLRQILDGVKPANSPPIRVDKVPGSDLRYSGGGIEIEQRLMMDVTNKPFPELMRNLVLNPLEMSQSTYQQPLPKELRGRAASGHDDAGRVIPGKWHVYPEMAAAGLWTNPADMSRYVIEVMLASEGRSQKVLGRDLINQMLTPQNGGSCGLGPFIEMRRGEKRFTHNGANAGFRCAFVGLLKRGDGAVVMTNSDNGDPLVGEILKSVAAAYGWD